MKHKLKAEFKNQIGDGLKIYFSRTRPVVEIYMSLSEEVKKHSYIWEQDPRILISFKEIEKSYLISLELKEYNLSFMEFIDDRIILNYEHLFDSFCVDLSEFLDKYNAEIKHIQPLYKEWVNSQDCINITNKIIQEYYDKGYKVTGNR